MIGIQSNGITLHVGLDGQRGAPPIVFSNSLGTDFRIWDRVVPAFADRNSLIRYDKRGHGLSGASDGDYSIDLHVADLEILLEELEVRDALLVGLSVGGQIAMSLAHKRPDLIRGLLLLDTAHKIGTEQLWEDRMAAIRKGGVESIAEPILERWFSDDFRQTRSGELDCWRAMLIRTPMSGYLGTCAALKVSDLTQRAKELRQPTLCAVGSEDGSTPPDLVRSTAALIPGAAFEEIEGSGHLPCIEKPERVIALIKGILKEIGYE